MPPVRRSFKMPKQIPIVAAVLLSVLVPVLPRVATAEEPELIFQLAMMDMMPPGGGAMQPAAPSAMGMPGMPAPTATPPGAGGASGMMNDDKSRMGAGMPGQAPTGQAQQQPMSMCPMCAKMMQDMKSGAGATSGMSAMGGGAAMGGVLPASSSAARLEGSIAFLRTELRITEAQAPAWDAFAATLRAGRDHLDAARAALQDSSTGIDPLMRSNPMRTT